MTIASSSSIDTFPMSIFLDLILPFNWLLKDMFHDLFDSCKKQVFLSITSTVLSNASLVHFPHIAIIETQLNFVTSFFSCVLGVSNIVSLYVVFLPMNHNQVHESLLHSLALAFKGVGGSCLGLTIGFHLS
jgi:hypothetical protein